MLSSEFVQEKPLRASEYAPELIIYDFDGVIADSEVVANTVLAEMLTEIGLPTTLEDALRDYCGWRWVDRDGAEGTHLFRLIGERADPKRLTTAAAAPQNETCNRR